MVRTYFITFWAIGKIHVRLGISSCWRSCVGWAWRTTCGSVSYVHYMVRILIDWMILKIGALNLEKFNILERLSILINRFIYRHFKLKWNIFDPLLGNSSLPFIKAREVFFNTDGEWEAFYSLGFNQSRNCYGIAALCRLYDLLCS